MVTDGKELAVRALAKWRLLYDSVLHEAAGHRWAGGAGGSG